MDAGIGDKLQIVGRGLTIELGDLGKGPLILHFTRRLKKRQTTWVEERLCGHLRPLVASIAIQICAPLIKRAPRRAVCLVQRFGLVIGWRPREREQCVIRIV